MAKGAKGEGRAPAFAPPPVIGEYRIVGLAGKGGMGQVYLAHDTLLERPVALKLIAQKRPDEQARRRFAIEARAIARLSHPNVVAVYRVGEVEGRPYLVSEFVRGKSLAELAKPIPWERALAIGVGLSRGLSAAHRQGILHRDLKPANVMLAEDGEVKLLDFGLAKLLDVVDDDEAAQREPSSPALDLLELGERARERLTTTDEVLGTPLYMAPEVRSGEPATRRSDLYALGAVLYELCTGKAPRETVSEDLPMDAWLVAAATPLAELAPGIDPRFAALVERCLHADPERRWPSADALLEALERLGPEAAPETLPEGNPYRGLSPFETAHQALFFGRGADVRAVVDHLRAEPLVLVAGDSGVGKSSLCRAGIVPRVLAGALADGRATTVVGLVPGRRPLAALAAALAPAVGLDEGALLATMRDDPAEAGRALRRAQGPLRGILVFVDQLEELCTQSDPEEARIFAEVVVALGATAAAVRVLAAVRGDFVTRLAALPAFGAELSRALHVLCPLTPEGLRQAIVEPARRKGFSFGSASMIEALVSAEAGAAGGLPLLQFAMAELWEARDVEAKRIPESALDAIGGVAGALAHHADGVVSGLDAAGREAAPRILVRLVSAELTRLRCLGAELGAEAPDVRRTLDALVRGRLIVARDEGGETAYEIAHEALIQGWGTLRGWLDGDHERRRVRERVEAAAAEWIRLDRTPQALWQRRQLAEASGLDEAFLGPRAAEFLAASRRAVRRAWWVRTGFFAAAPAAVALTVGAARFEARRHLDQAITGHLARADTAEAAGRERRAEADRLRHEAFARFDAAGEGGTAAAEPTRRRLAEAETSWAQALAASREADSRFAEASRSLEAAFVLDPTRPVLRGRIADVDISRITLAEWFFRKDRREILAQRLGEYDSGGDRARALAAAPALTVETSPPGAEVTLARYENEGGKRRLGAPVSIGQAPLTQAIAAGPGSYRLTLTLPGRATLLYPVLLAPGEKIHLPPLDLPEASAVPAGFVYVPPGRFLVGSADPEELRRSAVNADPLHEAHTGGFLVARAEVTFADWLRYLRALPSTERARELVSAHSHRGQIELHELVDGTFELTSGVNRTRVTVREGEKIHYDGRARRADQDWLRLPVGAVSLHQAERYLAWLDHSATVPGARLCDEHEWERAARGADDRLFPHGDTLDPDEANFDETYGRVGHAFGPDEVGAHPATESPFGLMDASGNIFEWTRSLRAKDEALIRGGAWYYDRPEAWIPTRTLVEAGIHDVMIGLRVCATFPRP
jgi:formylglycine-generating enzyme required for sulfatase activity